MCYENFLKVHKNNDEKMFAYGCFVKMILSTNTSRRKAGKQQLEIILRVCKKVLQRKKFYYCIIKILDFFLISDTANIR